MLKRMLCFTFVGVFFAVALSARENPSYINSSRAARDVVIDWNDVALDAIRLNATPAPEAARILAIMHIAMFDAVNSIDGLYEPYLVELDVSEEASAQAAATAAAHRVLTRFFPDQAWMFDNHLRPVYSFVEEESALKDGIAIGRSIADAALENRFQDNSDRHLRYIVQKKPGLWNPTPPDFQNSLLPQWSSVTPFAIESGTQFRPGPPPALNSRQYKLEFDQVKEIGRRESNLRTPEKTEIALFWEAGLGTATTPGQWNQIAQEAVKQQRLSLVDRARVFALLNIALADAGIAAWDAKYRYNFWRPVDAIRAADTDRNPETQAELDWTPLLASPPIPEYVSAHSAFSAAGAEVLSSLFGDDVRFQLKAEEDPRMKRHFRAFTQAAQEAGASRIYGGQHFQSSNQQGLQIGQQVGQQVLDHYLQPKDPNARTTTKLKRHFHNYNRR